MHRDVAYILGWATHTSSTGTPLPRARTILWWCQSANTRHQVTSHSCVTMLASLCFCLFCSLLLIVLRVCFLCVYLCLLVFSHVLLVFACFCMCFGLRWRVGAFIFACVCFRSLAFAFVFACACLPLPFLPHDISFFLFASLFALACVGSNMADMYTLYGTRSNKDKRSLSCLGSLDFHSNN